MARIRSFKPTLFSSEDVATLSLRARWTWLGMWSHADDAGRLKDNVRLIKGDVWPLEDDITIDDIAQDLDELAAKGRILRYEVDGRRYIQIVNWWHQKISKPTPSRTPAPPGTMPAAPVAVEEQSETPPVGLREDSGSPPRGRGLGRDEDRRGEDAREPAPPEPAAAAPPPSRCERHTTHPDPPPCGPCAGARRRHEAWEREQAAAAASTAAATARRRADERRTAVAACDLCNTDGRLASGLLCAHDPAAPDRTRRGAAAARAAITRTAAQEPPPTTRPPLRVVA